MKHKALIFDLYGTLIDFPFVEYQTVVQQMAARLELPAPAFALLWWQTWADHELGRFASVSAHLAHLSKLLNVDGAPSAVSALEAAAALHRAFQRQIFSPKGGAIDLLVELKQRGYRLGLITNCPLETPALWPQSDFSRLMDVALFSTQEQLRKPDPALFARASHLLQLEPSQCAMVGDSWQADVLGAQAAGMAAYRLDEDDESSSSDDSLAMRVGSFAELLNCLR